jgi:excisionase family DNA binding protein
MLCAAADNLPLLGEPMRTKMELLRAKDVAPMLGVGTRRVLQLVREGRLPAVRAGRAVRFPRLAVEACFRQWTEQALEDMSRTPPPVETDQPLANAICRLASASPLGWTGTASELLDRLDRYREQDAGSHERWPRNGRGIGVTLRRLLAYLRRNGVLVQLGRRGHRGRRLISISDVGSALGATAPSAASRWTYGKAAPGKRSRSSHARADADDSGFTGRILIDSDLLDERRRGRDVHAAEDFEFDSRSRGEAEDDPK